jgi:GNAT superfamily N-acetyltransferase
MDQQKNHARSVIMLARRNRVKRNSLTRSPPLTRFEPRIFPPKSELSSRRAFPVAYSSVQMEHVAIEPATLEDLPQLTELLFDLFTLDGDFKPDRTKHMRGLRLILEQPSRGRVFVARQNGRILAMINLLFTISTAEGGFVLLLEDIIVHHDHRHHGFGEMLLEYSLQFAREKNFLRVTLLTDRANEEAQKFFKHHGFLDSKMIPLRMFLQPRIEPETLP